MWQHFQAWCCGRNCAAPAVCVCVREKDRQSVWIFSICACVSVCVPSQFEMQHLQMCLVNCSHQLLFHSAGTIETKQLKQLSSWGEDLVLGCDCLCMSDLFPLFKSLNWTCNRTASRQSQHWHVHVCLNMEVRGHWQPVDTVQIYAHTHPCEHTGKSSTQDFIAVGFLLLLIFGSFQLQIPELELFCAPLPNPPNWERLLLRKKELNSREEDWEQILVWKWKEQKNK